MKVKPSHSSPGGSYYDGLVTFFDQDLSWWKDVYAENLPKGFFSFEMRQRLELVSEFLADEIRTLDNAEVLECGCGPGDILARLAPLGCKLTGVDLLPRYVAMASQKVPGARVVEGNVEQLPFPDSSFDIVYAVGLFQYVRDDRKVASEIARVTRPGGMVLVSVANYRMLHLLLDPYYVFRFFKRGVTSDAQPSGAGFRESHIRRYSLAQLEGLFLEHDLHALRLRSTSFGPLRFWRRELLPLGASMRISEMLRGLSDRKLGAGLKRVGNHMVLSLRKGQQV